MKPNRKMMLAALLLLLGAAGRAGSWPAAGLAERSENSAERLMSHSVKFDFRGGA